MAPQLVHWIWFIAAIILVSFGVWEIFCGREKNWRHFTTENRLTKEFNFWMRRCRFRRPAARTPERSGQKNVRTEGCPDGGKADAPKRNNTYGFRKALVCSGSVVKSWCLLFWIKRSSYKVRLFACGFGQVHGWAWKPWNYEMYFPAFAAVFSGIILLKMAERWYKQRKLYRDILLLIINKY